jgi:hypothetical protein
VSGAAHRTPAAQNITVHEAPCGIMRSQSVFSNPDTLQTRDQTAVAAIVLAGAAAWFSIRRGDALSRLPPCP